MHVELLTHDVLQEAINATYSEPHITCINWYNNFTYYIIIIICT